MRSKPPPAAPGAPPTPAPAAVASFGESAHWRLSLRSAMVKLERSLETSRKAVLCVSSPPAVVSEAAAAGAGAGAGAGTPGAVDGAGACC